ncbi:PQQ-binding-like beta-propeller repeat protein [Pseudoroseicyclus tamaricis]|uniref:PQQ-binding-like beta-propeller repeat protein n=1 Tax=Pseudoroseicyclus tamaricis TaxID=2705421 RepID=A0A6B2JUA1_9RHOB|nr:PQQ-like beta-propeller repeat protein [Pseudoroseicyclus tamaricis]NDV01640.1 PQQ-binding-like beta-propeller repeat protein [Pseudoroseicyclus tamaricis]
MSRLTATAALLLALAACDAPDTILPGERSDIRPQPVEMSRAAPIALPPVQQNSEWTHRGGSATHDLTHPALPGVLSLAFRTDIGEGNTRRRRITADPVVSGGRVFAMDVSSHVTAVAPSGAALWQRDLTPVGENSSDASGGGLAADGGQLFAATGFGQLVAMDAATGTVQWRQDLGVPGGSAPLVSGDLVYVSARGSLAMALDRVSGRIVWQRTGTQSAANFAGGAGPAISGDVLVMPFPSGEVMGLFPQGGLNRWSSVVGGGRAGEALAVATVDIGADPVIVGDVVYVGNVTGRLAALGLQTGERLWTATEGATSPVEVAGGSVFLVNDLGELVRLDASDGSVIWRVGLPQFTSDGKNRNRRFVHYGPVLAGGRLIVASSGGVLRQFDPVSGALLGEVALPGGAASHPAVAGGTLYVVNADGELLAFR